MKPHINYYTILNISPDASEAEIKQAFFYLAKKYHPDKNKATRLAASKFKQINQAYQILKDPEQRKKFDKELQEYQQTAQERKTKKQEEEWLKEKQLLEKQLKEEQAKQRRNKFKPSYLKDLLFKNNKSEKGIDIHKSLLVAWEEVCQGAIIPLNYERDYNGRKKSTSLEIQIPKNIRHGKKLMYKGHGGSQGKKVFGDLFIEIHIKEHPLFQIERHDVLADIPVRLLDALQGATITIPSLYGPVEMTIRPDTQHNEQYRLKGLGLYTKNAEKGDMFARIRLDFPAGQEKTLKNAMKQMSLKQKVLYLQKQNFPDSEYKKVLEFKKFIR